MYHKKDSFFRNKFLLFIMKSKTATEIKMIKNLERSHTLLHRLLEKYKYSGETSVARREISQVISLLANILAEI